MVDCVDYGVGCVVGHGQQRILVVEGHGFGAAGRSNGKDCRWWWRSLEKRCAQGAVVVLCSQKQFATNSTQNTTATKPGRVGTSPVDHR